MVTGCAVSGGRSDRPSSAQGGNWIGIVILLAVLMAASGAYAESKSGLCDTGQTDDVPRPIPESLTPAVNAVFGTRLPPEAAIRTTVFRCLDGRVAVCMAGANLPCGKANASRTNPGAEAWCKENSNAGFVPAFASGHDTIFVWRCDGGRPEIVRQISEVDKRGFIAQYWKVLP